MEKKNKIDSAIDEVLESKRLQQGVQIAKKGLGYGVLLAIGFVIIMLIGVVLGIVR